MANSYVQVAPDSTGKKVQAFENTILGSLVDTQAVVLVDSSGNPLSVSSGGSFTFSEAAANNSFGQSNSLTAAATATLVNVASAPAGYKLRGFIAHGTGDGYFFVQVASVTILSGRTRSTLPTLSLVLPNGIAITTGAAVVLKVTNEAGSTADYEGTLLGE